MNKYDLNGKVALITGGASGIGAKTAEMFVQGGAKVAVFDVQDDKGKAVADKLGDNCMFIKGDVTKYDELEAAVSQIEAAYGPLTTIVADAGVSIPTPVAVSSPEDFMNEVAVDEFGVFYTVKAGLPSIMKTAEGASIICIASEIAHVAAPGLTAYAAGKWSVRGMAKTWAQEFKANNIRVNVVSPGVIDTPMTQGENYGDAIAAMVAPRPIPRVGKPEEIAAMVCWLASDDASFATGADFVIDGGSTCTATM